MPNILLGMYMYFAYDTAISVVTFEMNSSFLSLRCSTLSMVQKITPDFNKILFGTKISISCWLAFTKIVIKFSILSPLVHVYN